MQNDDIIWGVIGNKGFCSFKSTIKTIAFCRNPYNINGLCNRGSCPLANSRYATVLEKEGVIYLYMKTIERAHTPANLWERVKLSKNYLTALSQIDDHLEYWSQGLIKKAKLRLTRIRQYLIRMRKLRKTVQKKLIPIKKREERRDKVREQKAFIASEVDKKIKEEIKDRLARGVYDQVNIDQKHFNEVVGTEGQEDVMRSDEEFEDEEEDDEEENSDEEVSNETELVDEYIEDTEDMEEYGNFVLGNGDEDDDEDDEEPVMKKRPTSSKDKSTFNKKQKRAQIVMEYEDDEETEQT